MRIAIIGNQARSAINFRGPLISELTRAGHVVFVYAPDYDPNTREAIRGLGATPVDASMSRTGLNPLSDLRTFISLMRLIRGQKIDSVLAYFAKPVIYGMLAARLAGVPRRVGLIEGAGMVFTANASESLKRRTVRVVMTCLYAVSLRCATEVFVLNTQDQDLFTSIRGVRRGPVSKLPGIGIDLSHYAKREEGDIADVPTFCLPARLIEEKGIKYFVSAARQLVDEFPDARFVVLGGIEDSPSAISKSQMSEWAREGVIVWPGAVQDVREYVGVATALVLPTYYREGLPRSILEAMAMGVAVITTDAPGCSDAVIHEENGLIVQQRDARQLAAAMRRYLSNPDLARRHGEAGRQRAESFYDVRDVNATLITSLVRS
ncbi:glycosyltransferase family 4 protein [Salinisphaera sp.]|uniref:glycosyltransferase family 4 protein n=1 Tax=Salinisphaera sp. TaxID=1914330 RepID=UPI0025E3433D|nr:glycosyltransferase family 4 protein [Salinisphaera sp.]